MNRRNVLSILLFVAGSSLTLPTQAVLPRYRVTVIQGNDLVGIPIALNNAGQVVGTSHNGSYRQAFVWQDHAYQHWFDRSFGVDSINDNGWVVGEVGSGPSRRGYVWDPVSGVRLLAQQPGEQYNDVTAINNANVISGYSSGLSYHARATVWTDSSSYKALLGHAVSFSYEVVINDHGLVAATFFNFEGNGSGMAYWDTGNGVTLGPVDGNVIDMNDRGDILSYKYIGASGYLSFVHDRLSTESEISPVSGSAFLPTAINDGREVVGYCATSCGGRALYWNAEDGSHFIDDLVQLPADGALSNLQIFYAQDINDRGWVVAVADDVTKPGYDPIGVLLTPVPEPRTTALLLAGLASVVWRLRARERNRDASK